MIINGRFLTRPPTGVDRFAQELITAWAPLAGDGVARLVVPANAGDLGSSPGGLPVHRAGAKSGQLWEQLDLPKLAGSEPLLNLCNTAPLLPEQQLVVIHDAAVMANPSNFSVVFRTWYRLMLSTLMQRARVVASVSKFSASELRRYFGPRKRPIEVVYEGCEHILRNPADPSVIARLGLTNRRFVLAVGNRSPNKNFSAVLAALNQLSEPDVLLVAAGGGNSRVFSGVEIADQRLVTTGYVTDAELRALYENSACFAFPSFYEGFGLPPLEAMSCGCPTIVSRTSSLPEVCGDAALYCDPADPASLADQLRRLLESASLQRELREAGFARARAFSWAKAATQFDEVLRANFT